MAAGANTSRAKRRPSQKRSLFSHPILLAVIFVACVSRLPAEETVNLVSQMGGQCRGVCVVGKYAYFAEGFGMTILDVSNPAAPVRVGRLLTPNQVQDVFVANGLAYLVEDSSYSYISPSPPSNLRIADVSNPTSPVLRGSCAVIHEPMKVFVAGPLVFVCRQTYSDHGLEIIDASNPSSPSRRGYYNTLADSVFVSGARAYVAAHDRLNILNVSNPASPTLLGSYVAPAESVWVSGSYAYLAGSSVTTILDIGNPALPTLRGSYREAGVRFTNVVTSGSSAYLTASKGRQWSLRTLNVSNPSSPTVGGLYEQPGYAFDLFLAGHQAYVSDTYGRLVILDVATSPPRQRGSYTVLRMCSTVAFAGDKAYVADHTNGLHIVDIRVPASPKMLALHRVPGETRWVATTGSLAFVTWREPDLYPAPGGLQILNVTNPSSPVLVGSYNLMNPGRVCVEGRRVYVNTSGSVQILDVSKPSSPTLLGAYRIPGGYSGSGFQVSRSRLYVAGAPGGSNAGLLIVDVRNASSPALLGWYPLGYSGLCVSGNLVYLTSGRPDGDLCIVDVTDPTSPTLKGTYTRDSSSILGAFYLRYYDIAVSGTLAYAVGEGETASRVGGTIWGLVEVLDVSNPSQPRLRGSYKLPISPEEVSVSANGLVCALDGLSGPWFLRYTPQVPAAPSKLTASARSWNRVQLSFQDNSQYDDGPKLERRVAPTGLWAETTITVTTIPIPGYGYSTEYYDLNVRAGIPYEYRLRAYNSTGYSSYSNVASAIIPDAAPAAPRFRLLRHDSPSLLLMWDDTSNNEEGFRIERKTGFTGTWQQVVTAAPNTSEYWLPEGGLTTGTLYLFRVVAYNPRGTAYSNEITYLQAAIPPAAPSNLTASAISPTQAELHWRDNSNNEGGFRIDLGGGNYVFPNTTSCVVGGLMPGMSYTVRVYAYNSAGETFSGQVEIRMPPRPTATARAWSQYE